MPSQTAASLQAQSGFDPAAISRKALFEKSNLIAGASDGAFAQVFADMQLQAAPAPASPPPARADNPPPQADAAPAPKNTSRANDNPDDSDQKSAAAPQDDDQQTEAKPKADNGRHAGKAKEAHHGRHRAKEDEEAKDDTAKQTEETKSAIPADAAPAEPVIDEAAVTADAGQITAQTDVKPEAKAVFCPAPQETQTQVAPKANADGSDNQNAQEQATSAPQQALMNLMSFRANPVANNPAAGKAAADASATAAAGATPDADAGAPEAPAASLSATAAVSVGTSETAKAPEPVKTLKAVLADVAKLADAAAPAVKADAGTDAKSETDVKTPEPARLETAPVKAQAPAVEAGAQNQTTTAQADFASQVQDLPAPKKEATLEKPAAPAAHADNSAAPVVKADAAAPSPSLPAAGSRLNAPTGFSAPSPNGPGGGPPSAIKVAGGVQIQAMAGSAPAAPAAGFDMSAGIRLTRTGTASGAPDLTAVEQVTVALSRMVKTGTSRFDVQLHPAELGKVDIRLEIGKDGFVRATVTADNPAAFDLLQKDSRAMERVLQQAGLQTDSSSLSFNLRDQSQAQQGQGQQQQNSQQGNPAWKRWADSQAATADVTPSVQFSAAPGRVDLTV